jgi:hypothetical protein
MLANNLRKIVFGAKPGKPGNPSRFCSPGTAGNGLRDMENRARRERD